MTVAYGPASLPSTDSLGPDDYTYVVWIPASDIGAGNLFTRLTLMGPATGQSRIQAMWIGYPAGSGLDFDGDQVQLRRSGSTSFTLSGPSLVTLDPANFALDPTKDLLVAYRMLAGDNYSYSDSVGAGFVQAWKLGTEDPALTTKSGYTTVTNRTALVAAISVAPTDAEVEEPCECDGDACNLGLDPILAGQVHSSGGEMSASTGHLHFMLMNPATSGLNGFLHQILITSEIDTVATVRSFETPLATLLPKCNLMFGSGPGVMDMTAGFNGSLLGNFHSIVKLRGGTSCKLSAPFPLVGLPPGAGVLIALHTANVGAVCNSEWQEVSV